MGRLRAGRPLAVAVLLAVGAAACAAAPTSPVDPPAPDPVPGPLGTEPPVNPYLADSPWPIAHRNTYQQDSTDLPGPTRGVPLAVDRLSASPGSITLAYGPAYADGSYPVWGSAWFGVFKAVQGPAGFRKVDETTIIPDLSGGILNALSSAYALADADGNFFAAGQRVVRRFHDATAGDPGSPMAPADSVEFPDDVLAPGDVIAGMNLTYDGHLVLVSKHGSVIALDRDLTGVQAVHLPAGEEVSNSIAIDEDGGIYVVSERTMRRVQWTGAALSLDEADGAWSVAYDGGPVVPAPGRLGPGSGTTPTLLGSGSGDRLVAIADGRDLMHVNLFWRAAIPDDWAGLAGHDRRFAADAPITFGNPTATRSVTEQSFTGRGYDVMAVSNAYGPPFDMATPFGTATVLFSGLPAVAPHGAEKFTWDPDTDRLTTAWANTTVSCPNGIPSMSTATGTAYCWGSRDDRWTLEALDWRTGATVFHAVVGAGSVDNSAYAGTEIGAFGAVVSGTLGGVTAVRP